MVAKGARGRRWAALASLALAACAALLLETGDSLARPTDYAADLERLDRELLALAPGPAASPLPLPRATRQVALLQRRASLTGRPMDETHARAATDEALQRLGPAPDLVLLATDLALRFHRVAEARADLARLPPDASGPDVDALRADLALQEGDDEQARLHCEEALRARNDWSVLARLAWLASRRGDAFRANALYAQAEDELTAKDMRAYAWLQLQRGQLALGRGRYAEAQERYARAERAYSGDWRVKEHAAELLGAQGRFDEAAALYAQVLAQTPRPEIEHALGDLLALTGRGTEARAWHDRALHGYLASVERGEVHYFHHLAGFYADVRLDGAEALRWARQDATLRRGVPTLDALAWALHRAGRATEALDTMRAALQGGVPDAHLCFHAAMVHRAAGQEREAGRWLTRAADLNPHQGAFHAHR